MAQIAPGWYTDPTRTYSYRYWDGQTWTNQVSSGGTSGSDPNPLDPTIAATPPAPGSEAQTTAPAPAQPAVQVTQSSGGSSFGTIIGVILAIIVVVILIAVIANSSGDDTGTTDAPTQTTEAPAETTTAP